MIAITQFELFCFMVFAYGLGWFCRFLGVELRERQSRRKCVRCGGGDSGRHGWIGVNVYDKVVGRDMGVIHDNCELVEGSPEWVKRYWIRHFLHVLYKPDYFSKSVYRNLEKDILEILGSDKEAERFKKHPITGYLKRFYPNTYDKS